MKNLLAWQINTPPCKKCPFFPFFRLASKNLHSCCWAALFVFLWLGRQTRQASEDFQQRPPNLLNARRLYLCNNLDYGTLLGKFLVRGEVCSCVRSLTKPITTKISLTSQLELHRPVKSEFNICFSIIHRDTFRNADGVVILGYATSYNEQALAKLLPHRSPKTLFYYFSQETPVRDSEKTDQPIFSNLINYTVTYRYDSDIYFPYGWIQPKELPGEREHNHLRLVKWTQRKLYNWLISIIFCKM